MTGKSKITIVQNIACKNAIRAKFLLNLINFNPLCTNH